MNNQLKFLSITSLTNGYKENVLKTFEVLKFNIESICKEPTNRNTAYKINWMLSYSGNKSN